MKKIINNKNEIVDDMLMGYVKAHSDRVKFSSESNRIILRKIKKDENKTSLLIGNGSGHEPIAVGWIGKGLLDANIVGDIFAAPSGDLILEGIKEFKDNKGVILLVSNHAGDVMNGELAIELAQNPLATGLAGQVLENVGANPLTGSAAIDLAKTVETANPPGTQAIQRFAASKRADVNFA